MNPSDPSKSSPSVRQVDEIVEDVRDTYRAVASDVEAYEDAIDRALPPSFDIDDGRDHLRLPLRYWTTGRKTSRAVPAVVAYEPHLDRAALDEIVRVLTGLDVLVMMLDEIIDAKGHERRQRLPLAVNAAFSGLLAFASISDDVAEETVDAIGQYLIDAARIPPVEREAQRKLADIDDVERAMELIRFSYAFRAKDISAFATVPGIISDADRETVERIASDLRAYRGRNLLFDDIRDVERDQLDGIETPVIWLLTTLGEPSLVAERIDDVYRTFEYTDDAGYRERLRSLEGRPEDLNDELAQAKASIC